MADFERADSSHANLVYSTISIKEAALPALQKIDARLLELQRQVEEREACG